MESSLFVGKHENKNERRNSKLDQSNSFRDIRKKEQIQYHQLCNGQMEHAMDRFFLIHTVKDVSKNAFRTW